MVKMILIMIDDAKFIILLILMSIMKILTVIMMILIVILMLLIDEVNQYKHLILYAIFHGHLQSKAVFKGR